jgi:hypothetical protein
VVPTATPVVRRDETRIAGYHLPLAFLLLTTATLVLAWNGITYGDVFIAAVLAGPGAFIVLIIGTSRMMISGMAKRVFPLPRIALLPGSLVALGAVLFALSLSHGTPTRLPGAVAWSAGLVLHGALVAVALRSAHPETRLPIKTSRPITPALIAAALAMTLLAAIVIPLAGLTPLRLLPTVHLVLTGPITLVILVSLLELTPRFTGTPLPRWWGPTALATAPLGALLLFIGFHTGPRYLHPGAFLMTGTLVLAAYACFHMLRHARRYRASLPLWALAGAGALAGTFLGAGVAFFQLPPTWIPLHGTINLLGFMGAVVFAASIDLYGPALRPGRRAFILHANTISVLVTLSIILTVSLTALGVPFAHLGLWLYAAAALLHSVAGLRRLWPTHGNSRPQQEEKKTG